jgi:hypothetical protein
MTRRAQWLLVLLALVVAVILLRRLGASGGSPPAAPRQRTAALAAAADSGGGASRPARRGGDEPVREVVELRVADLAPEGGKYQAGRNPFAFFTPPPPPPPPPAGPTPEELAARRAAAEAARLAAAEAAAHPPAPKPPPIDFTYLGSFGPPEHRIAVFSDGETIYNALEGDVLEGSFRLVRIGYESVELAFVDFPELPPQQLPVGQGGI